MKSVVAMGSIHNAPGLLGGPARMAQLVWFMSLTCALPMVPHQKASQVE